MALTRKRTAKACGIGAIAFGVTFLVLVLLESWFEWALLACFLFSLALCHCVAAAFTRMTATHSRLIDYAYLLIAAGGVFIFAVNNAEKRYEYTQLDEQDRGRADLKLSRARLARAVADMQGAACRVMVVQAMPQYCERAKRLTVDYGAEDKTDDMRGSPVIEAYIAEVTPPDPKDEYKSQLYREIEDKAQWLKLFALELKLDAQLIDVLGPIHSSDIRSSSHGIFMWPFILIFAFALRITKTTIEVARWAK